MKPSTTALTSIILPTFNEATNIIPLVKNIHQCLLDYPHEILVIDDNSPDGTAQVVKTEDLANVRVILRTHDRGFAKSIRCGIEQALGSTIVVMDSDGNHNPKYLPFMIDNLRYYECVSASRFQYSGTMDSPLHYFLSWIYNVFVRLLTRNFITDSLYGYFAIRRPILEKLDYNKIFWGYGDYCIRLMYYLQRQRVSILQFPAVNGRRLGGQSKTHFFSVFFQYTQAVFQLVWRERINSRPKP